MLTNSLNVHLLKIDSSTSQTYYNSYKTAFLYTLSEAISVTGGHSIIYSLISATIPYSFYGLNKYNNMLDLKETLGGVELGVRSIAIPFGNYDAISFSKVLMQYLNTTTVKYLVNYNKISNKFQIKTVTVDLVSTFLFDTGINKVNSCFSFVGCPKNTDVIFNNEYIETGMITMNDIYHLQIKSDLGSQNVITSDSVDNILEIIPINNNPLGFIHHTPYIQTKYLLSQTNLQNIRIELTDNYNRPIDLNGIPFLLNIKCEIIKNTVYDVPTGVDPRQSSTSSNAIEQTPLERIIENSSIIDRPSPIDLNSLVEINIIQKMIQELSMKKKTKK